MTTFLVISCYLLGGWCFYCVGKSRGYRNGVNYVVTETVKRLTARGMTGPQILELLKAKAQ